MFPHRAGLPIGAFVADLFGCSSRSWSLLQVQSVTGATVHPGLEGHEGLQNRLLRPLACYPSQGARLPCESGLPWRASLRFAALASLRGVAVHELAEPPQSRLQPRISTRFRKGRTCSRMLFC